MRNLPPLKALRAFEATARHESITKAANELRVSHSAVSQQVKILEQYFGQKLFRRSGNGIVLTQHARSYLDDVRFCFDRLAVASDSLAAAGNSKQLMINATPSFAMRWLIPRISGFQKRYPMIDVRIETSETDQINHLGSEFDLIIRRSKMKRMGMVCERILDDVSVAVMSPRLADKVVCREPSDLLNLPLLHMKSRISSWSDWFKMAGVETHETLRGQVHDHFFLSLEAAINGSGVALAPRSMVSIDLKEGRLLTVFPEFSLEGPGFHGLYRSQDKSTNHISILMHWLMEEANPKVPD